MRPCTDIQLSVIYVMRVMTCQEYYNSNSPYTGVGDHCNVREIEASTARAISLMGVVSTICGKY